VLILGFLILRRGKLLMTQIKLGINAGFAINRFPEPEQWLAIVGEELGLRYVQFVADLLNPFLPERIIENQIERLNENKQKYGVEIETTFTSAFTRVNHLLHPDPEIRQVWFDWFKRFFKISSRLGAKGSGSHFGIMAVRDFNDSFRKESITGEGLRLWQELSRFAAEYGLEYLLFEPMSVPREMAATIDETGRLLEQVNKDVAIPVKLCLDVDHGDISSANPADVDPYAWLKTLGYFSPVVHIKQSLADKGSHRPFTAEYNRQGIIRPEKVVGAIEESGIDEVTLLLEISHRERYPDECRVLADLRESVAYWRPWVRV
jgi:sugar phosphate isomerase/epimerase